MVKVHYRWHVSLSYNNFLGDKWGVELSLRTSCNRRRAIWPIRINQVESAIVRRESARTRSSKQNKLGKFSETRTRLHKASWAVREWERQRKIEKKVKKSDKRKKWERERKVRDREIKTERAKIKRKIRERSKKARRKEHLKTVWKSRKKQTLWSSVSSNPQCGSNLCTKLCAIQKKLMIQMFC